MDQQGKTILWEILSVALSLFFISLTHFLSLPPSLLIYFSLWISLSLPIYLSLSVSIIISPSPPVSAHGLTLGQTVMSRSYALTIHKTNSINSVCWGHSVWRTIYEFNHNFGKNTFNINIRRFSIFAHFKLI